MNDEWEYNRDVFVKLTGQLGKISYILDIFWASWELAKCVHTKKAKKEVCNEYHFNLLT